MSLLAVSVGEDGVERRQFPVPDNVRTQKRGLVFDGEPVGFALREAILNGWSFNGRLQTRVFQQQMEQIRSRVSVALLQPAHKLSPPVLHVVGLPNGQDCIAVSTKHAVNRK